MGPKVKEEEVAEAGRFQEPITHEEIKAGKPVAESLGGGHHPPAQGTRERSRSMGEEVT